MLLILRYTCLLCFVSLSCFYSWTQAEVFTAISDVEPLLHTQKKIIDDLKNYIGAEEKRLVMLKKRLDLFTAEHEKAMEDIPNYLGNPINAFTLIKRLTVDLEFLRRHNIRRGIDNSKNITVNHEGVKYPTLEDLTGAAEALTRLQETYQLDAHELSEGMLNGVVYSNPMTVEDCFEIGRALYREYNFNNSLNWMTEALRKYEKENEIYEISETEILEYISLSHYFLGDPRNALKWAEKIVEIDPKHPRASANVVLYKDKIIEIEAKKRSGVIEEVPTPKQDEDMLHYLKEYKLLCRGEMEVPAVVAKRLYCRYLSENHPFLRLAPIKMEYLYQQPDVIVFHDVMSDDEIHFVQEAAKPRFKRALVKIDDTGALVPAKYRTSKSAWLRDEESAVVARVSQRVADMTGLSMDTAEELQVVNYGIGGHYSPHYDFTTNKNNVKNDSKGRRIATVLFYMSDVAQGGSTVFTRLGLSVFPEKGSAAFWYNLHPSGEGDLDTRHAACPVLHGSKWVSNKWIHERAQEFLRPCTLEYQAEDVMRKLPAPVLKSSKNRQ